MNPPDDMTKVIGGIRYSVAKATLIAHDVYWDGHNFERSGRNSWLYKAPKGDFFVVTCSQWQGEKDILRPVSKEEAQALYEGVLTESEVEYEEAFGAESVKDA